MLISLYYYLFLKNIMGNASAKDTLEGVFMYVEFDRPYFYPDNVVTGKLFIKADVPVEARSLHVRIKTKLSCGFYEVYDNGEERTEEKFKTKQSLLDFGAEVFCFEMPLNPGSFAFPF